MESIVLSDPDEHFEQRWNSLLDDAIHPSVMQSPFAWHLFNGTRNFNPVLIGCFNGDDLTGLLLGVLIRESSGLKGFFSSRLVIYGGPLLSKNSNDSAVVVRSLMECLIEEISGKSIFIQLRASYDLKEYEDVFQSLGFKYSPRLNLLINTSNRKLAHGGVSASRRRQIRKSLQNGAEIVNCSSGKQLLEFYGILKQLYREKVRKPLPDFSFFESFFHLIQDGGNGKILLIQYHSSVIGGIIFPFSPDDAVYEWYVCGLDHEFRAIGIYPSVLATWAAIEFAIENNIKLFDFMGVGKPDEPYGVRDFKMRFGGDIVNYGRYIRINNKFIYALAELGFNAMSMLKKV